LTRPGPPDTLWLRKGTAGLGTCPTITSANNTFAGVTGFQADGFYNDATGWGTVNTAAFVPALARAVGFGGFGGF
jgi:hypothetical protein